MAATHTSVIDAPEAPDADAAPLPVVNPITVSMALAVVFLIAVLAVVSVRPAGAGDTQGADEQVPAKVAEASTGR